MSFLLSSHLGYGHRQWQKILQQVLPNRCAICTAVNENLICLDCERDFFTELHSKNSRCTRCALPLPASMSPQQCGNCLQKHPYFDRTIVACNYVAPIDHLVLALKFGHQLNLAKIFAKELRNTISNMPQDSLPDLICPIPLGPQRLISRGFNQSLEIAKPLGSNLGIPVQRDLLLRIRDTQQQSSLHPDARQKNVRHVFMLHPDHSTLVLGKHIALVDDVITTGTTLNEAAKVLKRFGAKRVSNFVFARTIWV